MNDDRIGIYTTRVNTNLEDIAHDIYKLRLTAKNMKHQIATAVAEGRLNPRDLATLAGRLILDMDQIEEWARSIEEKTHDSAKYVGPHNKKRPPIE